MSINSIEILKRRAVRASVNWAAARKAVKTERAALRTSKQRLGNRIEAQKILQAAAQQIQQQAHQRISAVVEKCLRAVFGEAAYGFRIDFERKRGRTEARMVFVRGKLEVDPLSAAGGGMIDVAAFALRAACLVLTRPPLRRVLILDESFKYVSEEYRSRVADMLTTLSAELGVQVIQVTHAPELQAGKIIQIS